MIYDSITNFYDNPDDIRADALCAKYERIPGGPYLGRDTLDTMRITPELTKKINSYFSFPVKIVKARYRYALEDDFMLSYIHSDQLKTDGWHVIIPLTKSEQTDGLYMWEHVTEGRYCKNYEKIISDTQNLTKWKMWHTEPYQYNKAVIVNYAYFHSSIPMAGFGTTLADSRLLHIIEVVSK